MHNILITGAHGFVGSNLSKYLAEVGYYRLFALDIVKKTRSSYFEEYTWNDLSEISFDNIHTIIHLAGKAHDTKNTSKANEYFDINVGLTKLVFDQFLQSEARKFIYFSSVKAVTDTVKNKILTEEDIPDPKTPYGQSKLEAEKYILSQQLPEGKKIYILRPAMIHGPGNKGNLNLLYNLISKGIPYPLGAFLNKRSFTSIGNLNYIIEQLIKKDIQSGIYQMADNEPLSTNEVIELIAKATGRKPRIWNLPIIGVKTLARLGDFLFLPLNSEKLKKLTENYEVSNKKITDAIGDELPISARNGLLITLNSFRNLKKPERKYVHLLKYPKLKIF